MGLFQNKQQSTQPTLADVDTNDAAQIFDEQYREDLRASGRDYFKRLIDESAVEFRHNLDATVAQVNTDLKDYMTQRLDETIANVNHSLEKHLDERLVQYDRVTKDAQDLAVQSLNRNAQVLHDKYQQLSQSLQQTIAGQEAMMIGVFDENKSRMITTQNAQELVLRSLQETADISKGQSQQLTEKVQATITEQEALMANVFEENTARVTATKTAQELALQSLTASAEALQQQHEQLSTMIEQTVTEQKAMMVGVFQDNMARIIEHYLLGALGDQYDFKAQLPMIIQQMEANKQAIADDMQL